MDIVQYWVYFFLGVSVLSLFVAWLFARQVLAADTGTSAMQQIAGAIKEGAEAFLKRQYKTIYILSVVAAILIYGLYLFLGKGQPLAIKTVVGIHSTSALKRSYSYAACEKFTMAEALESPNCTPPKCGPGG